MNRLLLVLVVLCVACLPVLAEQPAVKAEGAAAPVKATQIGEITTQHFAPFSAALVEVKAVDYVPEGGYKAGMEGASQAYGIMSEKAFEKLGAWLKDGGTPAGPCFGIYYQDPEKTPAKDLTCKMGFPVNGDAKETAGVKIEKLAECDMAVLKYQGPYEESAAMWGAIDKWIIAQGYQFAGPPMEVYIKGPGDKVSPAEYLTEIRVPVMKTPPAAEPKK